MSLNINLPVLGLGESWHPRSGGFSPEGHRFAIEPDSCWAVLAVAEHELAAHAAMAEDEKNAI